MTSPLREQSAAPLPHETDAMSDIAREFRRRVAEAEAVAARRFSQSSDGHESQPVCSRPNQYHVSALVGGEASERRTMGVKPEP